MALSQAEIDAFLRAELADWLKYAEATLKARLKKQDLIDTQNLVDSIRAYASKPIANNSGTLTIDFAQYGRILDIIGSRRTVKPVAAKKKAVSSKGRVKVKNKKWYARNKQGIILNLIERLVTTEAEVIAKGLAGELGKK